MCAPSQMKSHSRSLLYEILNDIEKLENFVGKHFTGVKNGSFTKNKK